MIFGHRREVRALILLTSRLFGVLSIPAVCLPARGFKFNAVTLLSLGVSYATFVSRSFACPQGSPNLIQPAAVLVPTGRFSIESERSMKRVRKNRPDFVCSRSRANARLSVLDV
jgi:hypothetical protein